MVEVKEGMTVSLADAKSGNGGHGPYFLVNVKADKGYDKIQIWATNAPEAAELKDAAVVKKIKSAKLGAHQYNGKWYNDYSVSAELAQGNVEDVKYVPVDIAIDDAELPF